MKEAADAQAVGDVVSRPAVKAASASLASSGYLAHKVPGPAAALNPRVEPPTSTDWRLGASLLPTYCYVFTPAKAAAARPKRGREEAIELCKVVTRGAYAA
ncbi:MAG: hypothetical protein QW452_07610 [Pyrobaculum sp.]